MNSGQSSTFSFSNLSQNNQFSSNQQTPSFGNTNNPSQQNSFGNMYTGNAFGGNTNAFGQNNGGNSTNSGNTGFGQTNQNGNSSFGNTSLGKPSGNGASTGFGNLSTGNSFATTGMNSNGGSSFGNNQNISGNSAFMVTVLRQLCRSEESEVGWGSVLGTTTLGFLFLGRLGFVGLSGTRWGCWTGILEWGIPCG